MIRTFQRPFQLLSMIFRHGKWRHSGFDFNVQRDDILTELQAFVPSVPQWTRLPFGDDVRRALPENAIARNILAQLALMRSGLTSQGGHLHLPFLNISYIRIPKAASTSLSLMMLQEIYPGLKHVPLTATDINYLTDANLRRHITPADPLDIFFTAVRNPFARIVSVYRDFFLRETGPFIYEDYLFGILSRGLSFAEFVRRISVIPDFLKDQHFRSQHEFIDFYVKKIPNVVVLKLEDTDQLKSFCSIYNLDLSHLNRTGQAPYDFREYYDYDTFQRVTAIYRKDLKRFNYGKEARALRAWLQRGSR